jgi:hypothetical protein
MQRASVLPYRRWIWRAQFTWCDQRNVNGNGTREFVLRKERRASWLIGLVFGAATGFMTLLGGTPFLFLSLASVAGTPSRRSLRPIRQTPTR